MKNRILTFFVCGVIANAYSQDVTIPDATFKAYLLNHTGINTNFDDDIQVSEALNFTDSIICPGLEIHDLTGIEAFENITFLSCANNQLTSLNVYQNTALQDLICAMNDITSLDVSFNPNLKNLRCSINPIQNLTVGNNPNLEYLYCESNDLTALDVTQNPGLLELYCSDNSISTLNLSQNPLLIRLDCSSNPLSQLDLAPNNALEYIMCNGNQLPSIALDQCPSLVHFRGVNNTFTQLDLSNCPNLQKFDCPFTQLTSLDFSHNPQLQVVYCFSSDLTSLNIANGNNAGLQLLWAQVNQLTCIKVDDEDYSTANWIGDDFVVDEGTVFSETCTAGLSSAEKPGIELYPNPAATSVNITISEKGDYKLTSANGSVIEAGEFTAGNHSVNIESLATGVYFFEFTTSDNGTIVHKLQKQ